MHGAAAEPTQVTLPEHFPLLAGLRLHPRGRDEASFVLEDTARGKYFRLGPTETQFVAALIETQSARQAHQICLQQANLPPLEMENAVKLCKWLITQGLVQTDGSAPVTPAAEPARQSLLASAFFWKASLLNPDRFLQAIVKTFGWVFSPQATWVGILVFVAAILQTTGRWSEFTESYDNLWSAGRWLWLGVAWCLLKVLHETAHGATCRRYGGSVTEAGIALILFVPIAYVNVTSSWRFSSRWQRLHVTLAGVAAELFVAGVALIAWNMLNSPPLRQTAADVVLLASVSSLLFNLNPLLKFDGYFALADITGVDNLYSYGQRYAQYFGGRYILGLDVQPPQLPGKRQAWIKVYGLSSAVYRVFTVSGLLLTAAAIFHGAGLIIAIAGGVSFIGRPLWTLAQHLGSIRSSGGLRLSRLALRLGCLGMLAVSPLWIIPANWHWTAPAIVEYDPPAVLRNRSAGFVETIHVRDGQRVVAGQPIVSLRNEDLELQLFDLKRQLAQVEQENRAARWHRLSPELGDALARESALAQQITELTAAVDALVVRAPCPGTLVSRRLRSMLETYVEPGEELAVVGVEHAKRLKVSISQSEARQADTWKEHPLRIIVSGQRSWTGVLTRLETRATAKPPAASLLANNGGPLAAIQLKPDEFVLCEPRVNAFISLTSEQSLPLRCGQRASVKLNSNGPSIGWAVITFLSEQISLKLM